MDSAFPLRDTLRAEVATVRLGYTVPPASQALLKRYESSQYVDRGSFEGLIVTRLGSIGASIDLYSPNNTEEFFAARCFEPTRPNYWCTYEFEVCDHISASASFMDLRLHGGLRYANERVRYLKATIRSWITSCGPNEDSIR